MHRLMPALNWALLGFSGLALLWRFYVMTRPFPIDSKDTIRGVLTAPLTMAAYAVVLGAWVILPLGGYLLVGGALLGLVLGAFTRIKVEDGVATGKRASFYLLIWGGILLLTQWLGTAVGDAGVAAGLTLMVFPMAMGSVQDLFVLARARKAVGGARRASPGAVAAGALVLAVVLGAAVLFPVNQCLAAIRFPGEDWAEAAAKEYNKGEFALAYELASQGVLYYGNYYQGELKAQAQLVASMASEKLGNGQAESLRAAAEATLREQYGKMYPASEAGQKTAAALQWMTEDILETRGTYTLRTGDVVYAQGWGAVYRQDIPELWARFGYLLDRYRSYPGVDAFLNSLLPVILALSQAEPLAPERTVTAAVAAPVMLAGSTLLDLRVLAELARKRRELGLVGGGARPAAPADAGKGAAQGRGSDQAAVNPELVRLSNLFHTHLAKVVEHGADLPVSLSQWHPDRPSWLDWIRRAVEKFMEYEDQIEAAGEVKELVEELTDGDELAVLALSRIAAAVHHLNEKGLIKEDHPLVTKLDSLAGRLGPNGIKAVLAAADAQGQDLPAVSAAMVDAVKSLSGE